MDIYELGLLLHAEAHGETEALLEHFVENGASNRDTRVFIAKLARGVAGKPGPKRSREAERRDERICHLVAFHMGRLSAAGLPLNRAFANAARELELAGEPLTAKRVKQIWFATAHHRQGLFRWSYEDGRVTRK